MQHNEKTEENAMNELIGHSANVMLGETNEGRLRASVELVLLVSEPKYEADPGGFVKKRSIVDMRFAANVDGLRSLADALYALAVEAGELEGRAGLKAREVLRAQAPMLDGEEANLAAPEEEPAGG
jgi:hypothetical protein